MKDQKPGEFDLISSIRRQKQPLPKSILQSIGDDCATIDSSLLHRLVISTDLLVEDVHFRRAWTSPHLLGMKSALVNLSDLAAMGANPVACLLSLGLPRTDTAEFFDNFISGFLRTCREAGMPLIGGDLSTARQVCISVTAMGTVPEGEPLYRSTAREGDSVLIIGDLGYSRYGLNFLESHSLPGLSDVKVLTELELGTDDPEVIKAVGRHLLPEVHLESAQWLRREGMANAMIDVSDGLGNDLMHILEESHVAAEIDLGQLPGLAGVGEEERIDLALNGGEDYALLFTASAIQLAQLTDRYPGHLPPWKKIGEITGGAPELVLNLRGMRSIYSRKGYDHFQ